MKKAILMAALATVMAAPAMAAADAKMEKKADMWFSKIDSNGDGMISKEEHDTFSESMFKEADKDGDGSISKDEMKAQKSKEHDEMKKKM